MIFFNLIASLSKIFNWLIPALLLIFVILLIRAIYLRIKMRVVDTRRKANWRIAKNIIWLLVVLVVWGGIAVINSCFDCDPPVFEKYSESTLSPITTRTYEPFTLGPGQTAILEDIGGKLTYTGWKSGAWSNEPTYIFEHIYSGKLVVIDSRDDALYGEYMGGEYMVNYLGMSNNEYGNKDARFIVKKIRDVLMDIDNTETRSETGVTAPVTTNTRLETTTEIAYDPTVTPKEEVGEISDINKDKQIMYWFGKINLHLDGDTWKTDPDGFSGSNIGKLEYCKKWYPDTISVGENELTWSNAWRNAGNTSSFTSEKMSYYCIQQS